MGLCHTSSVFGYHDHKFKAKGFALVEQGSIHTNVDLTTNITCPMIARRYGMAPRPSTLETTQ
jgi:hypothetical protein